MILSFWVQETDIAIEDIVIPQLDRPQHLAIQSLWAQELHKVMRAENRKETERERGVGEKEISRIGQERRRGRREGGGDLRKAFGRIFVDPQLMSFGKKSVPLLLHWRSHSISRFIARWEGRRGIERGGRGKSGDLIPLGLLEDLFDGSREQSVSQREVTPIPFTNLSIINIFPLSIRQSH
jgi:hypothetical protein